MSFITLSRRVYLMRANLPVWTRSLWTVVSVAAFGLTASGAAAQSVHLIAAPATKAITLPNGTTVAVPMWGYALDGNDDGIVNNGEVVTVPGPRIVVPAGQSSLIITLTNLLPEATSLVIPGQPFNDGAATPARDLAGRATSMTPETGPNSTATYTFPGLKPGTFLYQSGSHQAVQIQMGLYGAMTKDAVDAVTGTSPAQAYAGAAFAYAHEAVLVYSEIDQALHEAVNAGTYGTPAGPTSTIDYRPSLFLVNGESYTNESMATIAAGTAGETTLLRILNAGLRTHAPVLDNGSLTIVAEDGNTLPYAKDQATVLLAAGKTHDVLWTPAASGVYSLYDRTLSLNARGPGAGQGSAGMLAKLRIAPAGAPADGAPVAFNDSVSGFEDTGAIPGAVLANDTNANSAILVASPRAGLLIFNPDGTFIYTPNGNFFGIDEFSYRAVNASSVESEPALVTIIVAGVPDAPVANAQAVGVDAGGNVSVALSATDADGDAPKFYLTSLPTHGALSYIDPLSKVETPIAAANLRGAISQVAVPGGVVIYTPAAAYVGPDAFNFVAFDGTSDSAPAATVSATVYATESAAATDLTQEITLNVRGADGTAVSNYRWTLEEDLTYKVVPGIADPNTLAVSFHRSYMPVVAAGTQAQAPKVNPGKRYFVSVLPTEGTYSNGGAGIEANQATVTVTVSKLPLPTARIRVRVFQDNAPLNGMWDSTEPGLAGFQVTIDDAGGTYGMSGGHQSTDAFGNKIGTKYEPCNPGPCDSYQVAQAGDGFVLTDADGYAVIDNLVMGKYTVKVRAPGGDRWIQTSTIEGTPGIDAWVKPNEPQFFAEFGPPGPHVYVGFTRAVTGAGVLGVGAGPFSTISGRVTNLRMSRPIAVAQFSGAPFTHTRAWVALNSGATGGNLLYAQPTNADGTFSIAGVPSGTYQVFVFDSALDLIIGSAVVNVVAPAAQNVGDVAVFPWFTNLYSFVFDDKNGDGIHQTDEPGIPDQALNIRFRDGSIYWSAATDSQGFHAFNEVFPFFAWMVAEVDYARYHSTGVTVVVDDGGDARAAASNDPQWREHAGLPTNLLPVETLNPQLQPDNGGQSFRTESGAATPFLLLEGFQGFIGQSTVMLWGKAPYEKAGAFVEDVNVAPFDDFPNAAGGDVDANGDGFFNTDRSNGGIAGIVHYGITRAENDPRWAAAENWEPGVSDVRVQLWDASRTHLLNEVTTDNWNNSVPEGCQWGIPAAPYVYLGRTTDCFDGLRTFNQARPALFDGGYAFSTILQDSVGSATYNLPIDQRGVARPLPAGQYVVKIIVPPGYQLQKEEDKNVDFGDTYVPQQFWLSGYPLADGGPAGAQPAPTVQDNALIAPFCVGQLHQVPDTLSLFPGQVAGTFAGEMRPLCDAKLVTLRDGQQAAPDFHLFTEAPVAGHIYGMVLDDTTNEFDPNAPTFGEKYAVPFIGVAIRDWQGNEITRTYTDQYGMYNALVPSSYTANPPEPSGVSPSILSACINPPTMPGPNGTVVADPNFQKQYSHFCYPLQYLAGKTTYLDTPVVPTGAFTGNGTFPVDAEFPDKTPVIASVTGPTPVAAPPAPTPADPYGPYIVDRGAADNAARTIVLTSAASMTPDGLTEVANPAFDGTGGLQPKLIKRDYGFGTGGTVRLGGQPLTVTNWTKNSITAIVPTGLRSGQLSVEAGLVSCTVATAPLSTLNGTINDTVLSLSVANGDGRKFALSSQIQINSEVMLVTGGNRSTLAAAMGTSTSNPANTLARNTLRVPHALGAPTGDGDIFTPPGYVSGSFASPIYVSVDNEVMTLTGKSTANLTANLGGTVLNVTLNVTAGTGTTRFAAGDYIRVDNEIMLVASTAANTLTVGRGALGTTRVAHSSGAAVVALDRFAVTRGVLSTAVVSHNSGAAVIGDRLDVARAQDGTTAAAHAAGTAVLSYTKTCVTTDTRKSILGITLSVATPEMHAAKPPIVVGAGQSIQAAIDAPTTQPGQLILVKPGVYEEMVVMSKPVRLQGAGALSTAINVVTTPAERIQDWLDKMGNLLLSTPSYALPNQPAMTAAPFFTGDVAAVVGDEGPGVMVLSKNEPITPVLGYCLSTSVLQPASNFATPANEAYCLHNENYPAGLLTGGAEWRPNARIDGFSLIGASSAPGVLVNGYARYLEISNNKIYTNSGTYAGGIHVGHAGAAPPFANQDAHNDYVTIHNNMITQNAGTETAGGGGVVLGTGSTGYAVRNNFIAANFTAGNGGGIAHIGLSPGGTIDGNTVIFNETFLQAAGTNGGGIFIGGTPAVAGALTEGSGTVDVTNNLVQGNAASGGDGGGIALGGVNGQDITQFGGLLQGLRYRVRLYNNVIANNVAGLAGGGISISDAAYVDITHDTIVDNDSTGTAGAAFTAGPLTSVPQPAGIVARGYTPLLAAVLSGDPTANVTLANSVVWHNRTFYFGPCTPTKGSRCGIVPVGPNPGPTQYAEIQITARPYWDLAVLGGSGQFNPLSSVLSALSGPRTSADYLSGTNNVTYAASNSTTAPAFMASYFNTDRRNAYQVGGTTGEATLISVPAALDEGGNFIRPQFGPLTLENPNNNPGPFFGNYHVTAGVNGAALGSLYLVVPGALLTDFDQQGRPAATPHRGADQVLAGNPPPTTPVPQR